MLGIRFTQFAPDASSGNKFDDLLKLFLQLLTIASGNVADALNWLNEIDRKYGLTDNEYGIGNFIDDLKNKNIIRDDDKTQTGTGRKFHKAQKIRKRKS
jgi:hypothetical protein